MTRVDNPTAAWADAHDVTLTAVRTTSEWWRCEARTTRGVVSIDVVTDHQPDPFAQLFGVWADETPGDAEYTAAAQVLGPNALRELARLLGWL